MITCEEAKRLAAASFTDRELDVAMDNVDRAIRVAACYGHINVSVKDTLLLSQENLTTRSACFFPLKEAVMVKLQELGFEAEDHIEGGIRIFWGSERRVMSNTT